MELHGRKVYLTVEEQLDSGYPSPIDLAGFPLHENRVGIDAELDRLEEMATADDELTHTERASLPGELERIRKISAVTREIGVLCATYALVHGDPAIKQ